MDDLSEMTLERFRLWSMHALKVFLSHRNRSVNGTFDELSARAFCVWEENLPVNEKAEQAEQRLLDEYKRKLEVEGEVIPDPFALSSGWKGEGAGMSLWPSVYVTDIAKFLKCSTPNEVVHRLLNEYKQGKAYRYFENGWVKEVYLHTLNESGDKCVLKTKVTPSMSINSKQYDVWVVVRKNSTDQPGGELLSAYCSCTAGMHGTCNHVAGLLFRVEHAVKSGETSKTATSKLSQWNVPKAKPTKKPVKASEIVWRKGHYGKSAANVENEKKKHAMKKLFTPLNKKQVSFVQDPSQLRSDLYSVLKDDIGDSCFAQMFEKTKVTVPTISLPPTLIELAHSLKSSGDNITPELFLTKLAMTEEMRDSISQATVDQSHSETWKSQRKGRLTASLFQRVSSRVKTLQQNEAADPTALVSTIMGETDVRPTNAMKHGLALEPEAKRCYTKTAKKKHLKLKTKESGLSVYIKKPYIAASADLEVECQCCGQGICEIKCPDSIKDQVPTVENVKYVSNHNGQLVVDKTHPYFYQMQGQMKMLGRHYCDLFVYTVHGSLVARVVFESEFWDDLEEKLTWFWIRFVLPCLIGDHHDVKENVKEARTPTKIPTLDQQTARRALMPVTLPNGSKKPIPPKKRKKQAAKLPVYLCGYCGLDCVDEPQSEADQSVNCDFCSLWCHYLCAGVTDESLKTVDKWSCGRCARLL